MRYLWACLAAVAVIGPAQAADQLQYGPPPPWVARQEVVQTAPASADAPFDFLLSDSQAKLEPGMLASYSHYAIRINNSQGLAVGNVAAAWDPAFDEVTIHRVALRRGGQVIDVLGVGQKFAILRREQNLEQQTLNGQLTATLQPEGLQVGDVVEVEMTLVRRDPTLRDHMEMKGILGTGMRIGLARLRLVTPAKSVIRERSSGLTAPVVTRKGSEKITSWTISPLVPERPPAFAPNRYAFGKTVDVSDYQSWNDLAALFVPLFDKASEISAASPLQAEIARIRAATADPVGRAELALQLVEEKIRYVNLALGVGGLVPASADQTWSRRFGDCKAKSALLIGLLKQLGVEAAPVLVHSSEGDGINERLPMVALFNHVIVRASIGGKTYWLDGTRSGDSKFATLEVPLYYWGLPIVRNASLVRIMPDPPTKPYIDTVIHTDASAGTDKPVPTTVDMTFRGDLAIAQNIFLSGLDPTLRDQTVRKQLQERLDSFEIDKVSTSYDAATQSYRIHGEGRQALELTGGVYWSEVPSPGYKADFRRDGMRDQDAPVDISYPSYNRYVQVISFPKNRPTLKAIQIEPISETVAGVEYRRRVANENGVMTIEATERSVVPEITYAQAIAAQDRLRALDKMRVWLRLSTSAPVATAEVKEIIGRDPKSSDDYFAAALKLLNEQELAKAMGALDKAIELAPANPGPRSLRAQLRLGSGDRDGAKADALATIKANPKDSNTRALLAEIYKQEGNLDAAYQQAASLANIDNAAAQIARGRIFLTLGRSSEALASLDRALSFEPDPMTHVYKSQALPAADKTARRKELDAALKLNPADAPSLSALAQLASQLGDHATSLQLLDQAFLRSPDNIAVRHDRAIAMLQAGKADAANREFDAISAKDLTALELNNLCWSKALANVALDRALQECDRSLAKDDRPATHDSKATVLLRQARFDDAIKEFDTALKGEEFAAPLYGRALAYARKGDRAKSDADAAKALQMAPGIDRTYSYYGLVR